MPLTDDRTEKQTRWPYGSLRLLFIYTVAVSVWLLVGVGGEHVVRYLALFASLPASLVPIAIAIAAGRATPEGTQRKAFFCIALALSLYYVGDAIGIASWLEGKDPFPGPADVFYTAFYIALTFASIYLIRATSLRVQWLQMVLDATIFVVGFGAFFWYFVIRPTAAGASMSSIGEILAQLYAALDCALLLLLGVALLAGSSVDDGTRRVPLYVLIGFAVMFMADIVWSLAKLRGHYLPGQLQDVLYLAFNVPLAAAGCEQLRATTQARRLPPKPADTLARSLPYAAMFAAFVVLVFFNRGDVSSPSTIMTVVVFGLTLLIMVRQTVVMRSDALVREQKAAQLVEARYASLIANATDVTMIVDPKGVVAFVSPAAVRVLWLVPAEMVGRRLGDVWTAVDQRRLDDFIAQIAAAQGETVGPIELTFSRGGEQRVIECVGNNLTNDSAVAGFSINLRDISERKALEEQLRHMAFHDPLTLLANRTLLRERVQHAITRSRQVQHTFAVMYLDLDHFKSVNDMLGHDAGDKLLRVVSQRLTHTLRASDTVARLGGDEFGVLLDAYDSSAAVEETAQRLIETLSTPIVLGNTEVRVGASIGIAWHEEETSAEVLLGKADVAMYHAKAAGKGRAIFFQPHMQDAIRERLRLENDIERALANDEFTLEYQPIVDLGSRSLLGVEALVRWRHPELGLLMPSRFIQIVEERGQIANLGRYVLNRACVELCQWRDDVAGGRQLRLTVNISGRHLQHGDLVNDVQEALRRSGLEADNLVVELTESTIMQKTEIILERFRELKALGVRLAIDDFGVGYSSLSYLHKFPIDILKIDRSFVGKLLDSGRGSELARAVITLGETLGLDTVAEGVETEEQIGMLLELGCVAGQGFVFQKAGTLGRLSASSFVSRRNELWSLRGESETLSPTGRYQALDLAALDERLQTG